MLTATLSPWLGSASPETLLLTLFCSGLLVLSSGSGTIPLGSILSPASDSSAAWISPGSSFRFGFYNNPGGYLVGVLFHTSGMPTTAAWSAVLPPKSVGPSASFRLASDGNLILTNGSSASDTLIWSSGTAGLRVASAAMRDDGNFVLQDTDGKVVWQTFDRPTDTLLQNQTLRAGMSLSAGLAGGGGPQYLATMEVSGNLTLTYVTDNETFWSSGTASGNGSYASLRVEAGNIALAVYTGAGAKLPEVWYPNDYTRSATINQEIIRRVTLGGDGNLRIYSWAVGEATSVWSVGWQAVADQCLVPGFCGPNGICSYNMTGIVCGCAASAGFSFIDPSEPRLGCSAPSDNNGGSCSSGTATMVPLNNTQLFLPTAKSLRYDDSTCHSNCLNNDLCTAATALNDGSGMCLSLNDNQRNFSGYQELSITATTYLKFCGEVAAILPPVPRGPNSYTRKSIVVGVIVAVLATLAGVLVLEAAIVWICQRRNPRFWQYGAGGGFKSQYALLEYASGAPVQLTYRELRRATKQFTEKIGEGGFGVVYKGRLATVGGGTTEVAVKQLEGYEQGERQFRMEVAIIGSTHHMNLVRLCGFCAEGKHRLIIYEYMKNRSLDRYLFRSSIEPEEEGSVHLDWATRFQILVGAARGITYLHQECRDCIIHCDIKPENILLDECFTAKVSDFGLAKLLSHQKNRAAAAGGGGGGVTRIVRGTRGYLAPEWRSNLPITIKSDVFSFGMVVLETISGKKGFDPAATESFTTASSSGRRRASFSEWAYHHYFGSPGVRPPPNPMDGILDPRMATKGEAVDPEEFDRAMKVAYWCMQVQPSTRPSMSRVIQMFEGTLEPGVPPMPGLLGEPLPSELEAHELRVAFEQEIVVTNPDDVSTMTTTRSQSLFSSHGGGGADTTGSLSLFSSSPGSGAYDSLLLNRVHTRMD